MATLECDRTEKQAVRDLVNRMNGNSCYAIVGWTLERISLAFGQRIRKEASSSYFNIISKESQKMLGMARSDSSSFQ